MIKWINWRRIQLADINSDVLITQYFSFKHSAPALFSNVNARRFLKR